jgi:hypothetical protein
MSKWLDKQKMIEAEEERERLLREAEARAMANADPVPPEQIYISDGTKTVWELINGELSNLGFSAQDLIDHNDIADANAVIPEGQTLHLPYPKKAIDDDHAIRYELFSEPKQMHVNLVGGTRKQSFGNAVKWEDVAPSGPGYRQYANVDALGVAYVPIADETAAYYLDALSLGNYKQTGRLAYTIGFNHSHLSEGYYQKQPDIQADLDNPSPGIATLPTTVLDVTPAPKKRDIWKDTYVAYGKPIKFSLEQAAWIRDYDAKRPDKWKAQYEEVTIAGVFSKDDQLLGRPLGAANAGLWFGIPMDMLKESAEVYNTVSPYKERKQARKLTTFEKYVFDPLFAYVHQKNKNNNKTRSK